jgi:hypothetical protein
MAARKVNECAALLEDFRASFVRIFASRCASRRRFDEGDVHLLAVRAT